MSFCSSLFRDASAAFHAATCAFAVPGAATIFFSSPPLPRASANASSSDIWRVWLIPQPTVDEWLLPYVRTGFFIYPDTLLNSNSYQALIDNKDVMNPH